MLLQYGFHIFRYWLIVRFRLLAQLLVNFHFLLCPDKFQATRYC